MLGSTIAYIPEASMPARVDQFEDLFDCAHVGLDVLLTLDFVTACQAAEIDWFGGEPKLFDKESGLPLLFPISEPGARYIRTYAGWITPEQAEDAARLADFIDEHGTARLFEVPGF